MSELIELDEKDIKLLEILASNARATYTDMARVIGISDVAVMKRVKRLESRLIKRYTIVVDPRRLGFKIVSLTGIDIEPDKLFNILEYLKNRNDINFVIVLCDWFARECSSSAASESFEHFDVHASPTTIVLYSDEKGEIKYQEKYEGVLYEFELKLILENFLERAEKHMRGEKVTPPISKESSSKALGDIVMQILKALIGQKE